MSTKIMSNISFAEIGETYIVLSHCQSSSCVDNDTQESSYYCEVEKKYGGGLALPS